MINKDIFSIWLNDNPVLPEVVRRCLESQKIPGYTHRLITLDNCFKDHPYIQQCLNSPFENKKWCKLSDFLRMHYLLTDGGIYLDADVEILPGKNFDNLLNRQMFAGIEESTGWIGTAVLGAEKGSPFIQNWMNMVVGKYRGDDDKNFESSMQILTDEYYKWRDLLPEQLALVSRDVFYPYYHAKGIVNISYKTICYHHFQKTWVGDNLPSISILIPTLGRPEGLKRCLDSISASDYPKNKIEILYEEDEPRMGVAKRLNGLFRRSKGDWCVFLSNDTELTPTALKTAITEAIRGNLDLISFNTGPVSEDQGNINEHFAIKRLFIDKYLDGKIFCERMNHVGTDNLLWAQVKKYGKADRSDKAVIIHHHFAQRKAEFDKIYEMGWSKVEEDRRILKEELGKLQ